MLFGKRITYVCEETKRKEITLDIYFYNTGTVAKFTT